MSPATPQPDQGFAPWNDAGARPLVRFEGVSKRFDGFTAIDDLSLDIYEREFFALLGPSGCGKTTLMRILAGFETASSGRVSLDGSDLAGVPPHRRPVNMMFQSYALFPHMSVERNIGFGLEQEGRSKQEIAARVEEMLALVQLAPLARRRPHQLSGGQRQRVALARSLAKKPRLVLLDEPLGALDRKLREQTQFELMNIQEKLGITFIIVTHDQDEAMTVASRIAVMRDGRLEQVSPPGQLYEQPVSRFVADFVGDVNIIEGHIDDAAGGRVSLAWREGEASLTVAGTTGLGRGSTAFIALRPEKLRISRERPPAADNCVPGTVWDIAYTGSTSTYHVRLGDGRMLKTRQINDSPIAERAITWEDAVWVHWPASAGVLLER